MRTVLLIETMHRYQMPWPHDQEVRRLRRVIIETCIRKEVKALAEEMCLDGLQIYGFDESICQQIADDLDLAHKYCNPSYQEYEALGLIINEEQYRFGGYRAGKSKQQIEHEIRANHQIRERYRFERLLELDTWPVLFICGSDHTTSFQQLLQANDIVVHVLFERWVP